MTKRLAIAFVGLTTTAAIAVACGSSGGASGSASSGHGGSSASSGHGGASSATSGAGSSGNGGDFNIDSGSRDAAMTDGCGTVTLQQTLTPGNIVVVFDQSDSMNDEYGDGGVGSHKWSVAEQALIAAVTPNESIVNAGAIFFPSETADAGCTNVFVAPITETPQINIEPGKNFVQDFSGHFSANGWSLINGTPTVLALNQANAALTPGPAKGQSAVILLTDGAPTCDKAEADLVAPVAAMYARGIKTYAIGLPGSEGAAALLNAIAMAGGTTSYLSPADAPTLQAALSQIAEGTVDKCTFALNPPPVDTGLVNLVVSTPSDPAGSDVPRGDGGNGWTLSPDGSTATLEGAVCATAKAGGYTSIQFVYGCPTFN